MFERISEIEVKFEKAIRKDRIVFIIPIIFGFASIVLAILFHH